MGVPVCVSFIKKQKKTEKNASPGNRRERIPLKFLSFVCVARLFCSLPLRLRRGQCTYTNPISYIQRKKVLHWEGAASAIWLFNLCVRYRKQNKKQFALTLCICTLLHCRSAHGNIVRWHVFIVSYSILLPRVCSWFRWYERTKGRLYAERVSVCPPRNLPHSTGELPGKCSVVAPAGRTSYNGA